MLPHSHSASPISSSMPASLNKVQNIKIKAGASYLLSKNHPQNVCFFFFLEKEMATQSSILAWRIQRTKEPGGLESMGSHRVRHILGFPGGSDGKEATCNAGYLGSIPR